MHSLIPVADEILRLSKSKERSLTPLQLMKLSYISFGWYIANFEKRIFRERIEAWRYGPVMPRLYHATKMWGRKPIPFDTIDDKPGSIDSDTLDFLNQVVDAYGHLSGIALSELTHQEGSPWHQMYQPDVLGIEIPESIIYKHYKSMLDAANASATT